MTDGPLRDRVVVVTRPREEAEELAGPLRALGAEVLLAPAIRIEAGDVEGLRRIIGDGGFDWVVFTSAAGVRAWFEQADGPPRARVAAVGSGTEEALRARGVRPDLVPDTYTTEALGEAFPEGSGRVLLPRADIAATDLRDALEAKGWTVVAVEAYRTRLVQEPPAAAAAALEEDRVDAVTFTSASTVRGFAGITTTRPPAVCIGPVTAEAAAGAGFRVAAVAHPHNVTGVVDAVVRLLGPKAAG